MKVLQRVFSVIFIIACALVAVINICQMSKLEQPLTLLTFITAAVLFTLLFFALHKTKQLEDRLYKTLIFVAILLGFLLRLLTVIFVPCEPISDYGVMFSAAKGVAQGNFSAFGTGSYFQRFPHIIYYSLTSGLLMRIFGQSLMTIKVFNVIFKIISVFVMALIGKELFGKKGSVVCAFLYAVFPEDNFYSVVMATENFAGLFFILSVYFIIRAYRAEDRKTAILFAVLSGAMVAAGSLFRNVAAFFLAGYAVGILIVFAKNKKILSLAALIISFFILYQGAASMLYAGGVIPYRFSEGAEPFTVYMLVGTNFDTQGMYSQEDHNVYFEGNADRTEINKIVKERLFARLAENPERILPLLTSKTRILWSGGAFDSVYWGYVNNGIDGEKPSGSLPYALCNAFFLCVLLCCIVSMIFGKNKEIFCILALVVLASHAGLMMIEIQPRYAFSVAFLLIPIASGTFLRKE